MADDTTPHLLVHPRVLLSQWANSADEWVRYIVGQVVAGGRQLADDEKEHAYELFRQEKAIDPRVLPTQQPLSTPHHDDDAIEPLAVKSVSGVTGVNALVAGGVIEPHEGLTILFGENGTGKTGYSRIFEALAASRTADVILGDIDATVPYPQSAVIEYKLGTEIKSLTWKGQQGLSPFTRMSIFDSPSVSFHLDADLEYVYVPASLALFNHVIDAIKAVQTHIDHAVTNLTTSSTCILSRFARGASAYPLIETLGAATDLEQLKKLADPDPTIDARIAGLRRTVAALEADTVTAEITLHQHLEQVLTQATTVATTMAEFDVSAYEHDRTTLITLEQDFRDFRRTLFEAADLPTAPDDTWSAFIEAGEDYRTHLLSLGVHDAQRCIYCRQPLTPTAHTLVSKYSSYLDDAISGEIAATKERLRTLVEAIVAAPVADASTFAGNYSAAEEKPPYHRELDRTVATFSELKTQLQSGSTVPPSLLANSAADAKALAAAQKSTAKALAGLQNQAATRADTTIEKKRDLVELEAAAELTKSWSLIETQVLDAKQAERLTLLAKPMPGLLRTVTGLAKTASDQMVNDSFDSLFNDECRALRAPTLRVEFVGRQGRAQRRKVLSGNHKPSTVLSEGEQKVIAMADFLAEARLAGITAPVVFDDPVSSLDHRRVNEVAQRIALLAETNQVIVFTHDILFATTLLLLMESTKRCRYFQVTDESGKGEITRATGPRWDTLTSLKKNINETIETATTQHGDARAALVRTGYDWIRAWCEVFTETELLQGVTQRYQPNVRMTNLPKIKSAALPAAIDTVNRIFEEACRYIDGHSQPLASLGVGPTLPGLQAHWAELTAARTAYINAED